MLYHSWKSHQNHRNLVLPHVKEYSYQHWRYEFLVGTLEMQLIFTAHKHDSMIHDNIIFLTIHCLINRINLYCWDRQEKTHCLASFTVPVILLSQCLKQKLMCNPGLLSIPRNKAFLGLWHFYQADVIAIDVISGKNNCWGNLHLFCMRITVQPVGVILKSLNQPRVTPTGWLWAVVLAGEKWQQISV